MKERIGNFFPIDALGCMCGTSMDGLDLALIRTDGERIYSFGETSFTAFSEGEREILKLSLGKWPGESCVKEAEDLITKIHITEINKFSADIVGFHGQTIAHDPDNCKTHQIGSGDIISRAVKVPIVWDFRTMDIINGGQGAPLAPYFHFACAKYLGFKDIVAFLNLGGVGNITIVDPNLDNPENEGALLAFDTGPANAPIDDLMFEHLKENFDSDGQLARQGKVDKKIISDFLSNRYFSLKPPKSLDRNSFESLREALRNLPIPDAVATATEACVESVRFGLTNLPQKPSKILVSGGGRKNNTIMEKLNATVGSNVSIIDDYGLNGDMLEAQAFGFLAVRVLRGLTTSSENTTGVRFPVSGGTISFP